MQKQMVATAVSVEADIYVLLHLESEKLWSKLDTHYDDRFRSSIAMREQEVVHREPQSLPTTMSGWRHMHLSISADVVESRAAVRVVSETGLENMPDTIGWSPLRLVSTRLRDFLEDVFPQGSLFFPFFSTDENTGESKPTSFWYWFPRNYLSFYPNPKRGNEQWMRPQVWGALGGHDSTWEMYHNVAFQDYVADMPFWTPSPNFQEIAFRSDIYKSIKAAGFSGFQEAPADNYLRQTSEQCVGYIHYCK